MIKSDHVNLQLSKSQSIYISTIKYGLDFLIAVFLLLICSPIMIAVAIAIKCTSEGSIFYKALRGGYHNKPFYIYKFRTMVNKADELGGGTTALNDARVTRFGKILRKTKMDEIPQLINIIKGDMSFVGPRPELLKYTNQYSGEEQLIYKVRPGITDYSSLKYISLDEVVGEQNADYYYEKYVLSEKNKLRIQYVKDLSAHVDIKIFILTILGVVKKCCRYFCCKETQI